MLDTRPPRLSTVIEATGPVGMSLLRVVGEVDDLGSVAVLVAALDEVVSSGRRGAVVDLSGMAFCSVRGLRALVDAAARADARRVSFALLGASATTVRALRAGWPEVTLPGGGPGVGTTPAR